MSDQDLGVIKMRWTGVRPLLMYNGMMADPSYKWTKAAKEISGKKDWRENEDLVDQFNRAHWMGALYLDDDGNVVIPSDNIERTVQIASGQVKKNSGKVVAAAVMCVEHEAKLRYEGPKDIEKMYKNHAFTLRKMVVIGRVRVPSIRPMFPTGWSIEFSLEYMKDAVNKDHLIASCSRAGKMVGLCDWRPKFGRFVSEVIE